MPNPLKIEINSKSVLKALFIIGLLWLVILIKDIAALLFLSYTIYAALNTIVNRIQSFEIAKKNIPRGLAISIVFVMFIGVLGIILWGIVGPSYDEARKLVESFDNNIETIFARYELKERIGNDRFIEIQEKIVQESSTIINKVFASPEGILSFGRDLLGAFVALITVITIVFYELSSPGKIKNLIVGFFDNKEKAKEIVDKVETKLGYWLRGQIFLMFVMFLFSYIGFLLIGINFALPLAILVGLFDIIPILGPMIAFFFVFIVTLALGSPWQVLAAIIFFFLLQQLEGNFFVPKIMQSSVGLDPAVVIIALMIGSQLMGVIGAILSVPVAAVVVILLNEWLANKNKAHKQDTQQIEMQQ